MFPAAFVRDRFLGMNDQVATRAVVQPQGLFAPNAFFSQRQFARSELRERLGLSPTARIVLGIGYADHRKGIDLFVEAGTRLLQAREDVVCVWVGNHEVEAFARAQAIVERSGHADRFVFPGLIRDSDLFFAGADVYLLTSREDPFPSVVLQSLDIGVPVIAFEGAGGFVELLSRGCGVLVPHADTAEMARAVLRLLDAPEVVDDLVSKGREILAREFSFVNYSRGLVELVSRRGPTVSAVVPNYNYAKYLPARLRSIVNQTYPPHEVIFLDDCSTDNSVEVAAEILHGSGLSYRIITNKTNQGTYRQWLRGFREATSELIWIAEADDYCGPDLLERLTEVFDEPELMLAYSQSRQIDEEGRELAPDYLDYTADISQTKWRSSVRATWAGRNPGYARRQEHHPQRQCRADAADRPVVDRGPAGGDEECRRLAAVRAPAGAWTDWLRVRGAELAPPARLQRDDWPRRAQSDAGKHDGAALRARAASRHLRH